MEREVFEECGIFVRPIKKLYERAADTKIDTVAFWSSVLKETGEIPFKKNFEISEIQWVSIEKILNKDFPLYPGTEDYFFNHFS